MGPLITRIAPTPSGFLHLGNAYNFILTWWLARANRGKLVLRIDDADTSRFRIEYLEDVFASLAWLGIDIDEGPSGVDQFQKRFSQSLKREHYFEQLKYFPIFACECTRSEIRKLSPDGAYPGTCYQKNLKWAPGLAIRFRGAKVNDQLAESLRDMLFWRKEDQPAYQLASVIDDWEMGVNFIVRGEDLKETSAAQALLAPHLNWAFPSGEHLVHHPLLTDDKGQKLSKSLGSFSLKEWRTTGRSIRELIDHWAPDWGLARGEVAKLGDLLSHRPPSFSRTQKRP